MSSQLSTAFTFKLGFDIQPGCVDVGNLYGKHPCLVCAAPGGKVIVHSPHHARGDVQLSKKRSDISVLRFNKEVGASSPKLAERKPGRECLSGM